MKEKNTLARDVIIGAVTALTVACRFDPSGIPQDGGGDDDAAEQADGNTPSVDAPPGTPDGAADADLTDDASTCDWPRPPLHFDPCTLPTGAALVLAVSGRYHYDTVSGVLTDPLAVTSNPPSLVIDQGAQDARVLSTSQFTLGATSSLRVTGSLPLIIASDSTILVNGDISVASIVDGDTDAAEAGAGANPAACSAHAPTHGAPAAGTAANQGGGGGGGGGFRGDGGDGGDGNGAAKGVKGTAVAIPDELRGGCAGGNGGDGDGATGASGGHGGGAVELAARSGVTISGTIHAGGARGAYGLQGAAGGGAGGGGGGSGGMIYVDTTTLDLLAGTILAANGGGGGEGGDDDQDGANNAEDGQASADAAAKGSGGANDGGDGSDGAAGGAQNAGNAQAKESGGGGGGGPGFNVFRTDTTNKAGGIVISPSEQSQ